MKNLAINTMIDTFGEEKIRKPFKKGDRYMSLEINELMNKQIKASLNTYTTTGIFKELFKTEEQKELINGKVIRFYKIL